MAGLGVLGRGYDEGDAYCDEAGGGEQSGDDRSELRPQPVALNVGAYVVSPIPAGDGFFQEQRAPLLG
jgi:hypothetical protein